MLADSNLPHTFWAEALSRLPLTRCPTKAVVGMTPYEAWTEEKPPVDGLLVFGCHTYSQRQKEEA